MRAMRRLLLLATPAAILTGCATGPVDRPPAEQPTLTSEQRRLKDSLRGTPVVVDTSPDGRMRVEVPLQFSFDAGRGAVKPPLAAVLDRMAAGLRLANFDVRIAAPADPKGSSPALVQDRAASVRDYLVARGVKLGRIVALSRASGEFVEVLVSERATR
jgi:outer membrane protein OmpA-like peptidoglycan-associated protein